MKLVDFSPLDEPGYPRFGLLAGDRVLEIGESERGTLVGWIQKGAVRYHELRELAEMVAGGAASVIVQGHPRRTFALSDVRLHSPLNDPASIRDFYAFEAHIANASRNRGREVPAEWYQFPVFFFSNHRAIYGQDDVIPYPTGSSKLDYELEVAAVIGKEGKDIQPEQAEEYIFGYMIYNDWSARDIQALEMRVGLGPAKGKDFAQSFGPYLVTPDELADRHSGRAGVYDLAMIARVNGVERSRGNWRDLHFSFGEMIARASAGVRLYPGDVIGSGTVGTGCLLEVTGGQGPYLQTGDVVELEVERLGVLRNVVGKA
jgi:fumarylacetoacetate (FAA) hydrolase